MIYGIITVIFPKSAVLLPQKSIYCNVITGWSGLPTATMKSPGQRAPNLYDTNHLGDQPQVKLIIGCRSQRVQTLMEASSFVPHTVAGTPDWPRYRTRHVSPFTQQQTQDYIEKFVAQHRDDPDRPPKDWNAAQYKTEFAKFPEFQTLIDTPFMLWMTLSILPTLATEHTAHSQAKEEPSL